MKLIKFTQEGLEELKGEIIRLEELRPHAVKELSRARELGDLSENGLYTAAKGRLRSIDSQLRRLSIQVKLASVVKSKKYLVEQDGKQTEYEVVGDLEADPLKHKISSNSPMGKALINSKPGETIKLQTPGGEKQLTVVR